MIQKAAGTGRTADKNVQIALKGRIVQEPDLEIRSRQADASHRPNHIVFR